MDIQQFLSNWRHKPHEALVIEHCRERRIECRVGEEVLYLAPGGSEGCLLGGKTFEILILLATNIPEIDEHPIRCISRAQAVIAKEAHRYLMENLYERITIGDLAKRLSTSPTQ